MSYQFDVNLFEKQLMTLNPTFNYHEFAMCLFKSYNLTCYNTNKFLNALLQDKKKYPEIAHYFEFASLYFLFLSLKQKKLGEPEDYNKLKKEIANVWSKIC